MPSEAAPGGAPQPPPLPSDLGLESSSVPPPVPPVGFAQRLHPLTLVIAFWGAVRGLLFPAIVLILIARQTQAGILLLLFLVLAVTQALIRYFTFTYRIEGGELITRQGLLVRNERNIPLARVQDIRLEQGVLHRLLGVVDLHVETAGGVGAEASFSVLKPAEAERLRQALFEAARSERGPTSALADSSAPAETVVRRLSLRELVLAGITSNQMASTLAILLAAWAMLDDILPPDIYERFIRSFTERVEYWAQRPETDWTAVAAAALVIVGFGMVISVLGSIVLFHGFTLARRGEDLQRRYGLLTRRSSNLPRRRIQLLKIEETILRRLFRLATLYADTAGRHPSEPHARQEGRNVLLPVVPREEVAGLLPVFFPNLDPAPAEWRRVSPRAIRRGTWKGSVFFLLLALASFALNEQMTSLWPLLFLPLVLVVNIMNYRHLGYALGENYFRTRRGWLRRATHIVPLRNIQAVMLRQTPFDRRHGVATLSIDTAGQTSIGGGPLIHNVPLQDARELARILSQHAARHRFRW